MVCARRGTTGHERGPKADSFAVLVHHLTQAALAAGQRVRLQHPVNSCFVSYARADEWMTREHVTLAPSGFEQIDKTGPI